MAGDLAPRRRYTPAQREAMRFVGELDTQRQVEQARMAAMADVAAYGMGECAYVQKAAEDYARLCPGAAQALAFIASTTQMAIAHTVRRFGSDLS